MDVLTEIDEGFVWLCAHYIFRGSVRNFDKENNLLFRISKILNWFMNNDRQMAAPRRGGNLSLPVPIYLNEN